MEKWVDAVTTPLGLAGFVIFLVFTYLTSKSVKTKPPWMVAVFVVLAITGVAGGIGLAFLEKQAETGASADGIAPTITQETTGESSPAISNVEGDVTITIQGSTPKQ